MTITRHVFCGRLAAPDGGAPSTFEVTCRVVRSLSGLESMHIVGWIDVDGARRPVSRMGVTLAGASMRGRERGTAMSHLVAEVLRLQGAPGPRGTAFGNEADLPPTA